MSHPRRNVFVLGLDEANLPALQAVPGAGDLNLHPLLSIAELQEGEVSVPDLIDRACRVLDAFDGRIDAIVGYWDFPVSTLVAVLGERYGTRAPSLESVVKCEHKYWSRLVQAEVVPDHPNFGRVDLDASEPRPPDGVSFPMWLKPALSYSSELAYGVKDMAGFEEAVGHIRDGIARVGRPFEYILDQLELPPEMAGVGAQACLAEEALEGLQVAVEGYVHDGEVTVYGVLDSINYPDSTSFLRHQYPSALPAPVQRRLRETSMRVMEHIGMDGATFSIEFFYDPHADSIAILEINPRHSQSHAELFQFVDGVPNHHCMLALSLGEDPALPNRQGPYELAAKWYYRWFTDGVVRRIPSPDEVEKIADSIPGVRIDVVPDEAQRLSEIGQQDSYSYEVAHIFTGGDSEEELREKYDRCVAALRLNFDSPTAHSS
ncbi:acetyl-CoA carboxylase biotin carboxylase subunit family protein [Streptomyces sp. NPDC049813]|uniref:acetyl-CoA carboxylase biotin carboxylase subunit family protein n=1 Tax=Streptomyces sp. NPDC049813 TaxID=3365597 RepID=UPI0037BA845A